MSYLNDPVSETDLEHIAQQVKEGFNAGNFPSIDGESRVMWVITIEKVEK